MAQRSNNKRSEQQPSFNGKDHIYSVLYTHKIRSDNKGVKIKP